MSPSDRPHPLVRRLSAATRRALDRSCSSLQRVVRNPMPLAEQVTAWLNRDPDGSAPEEGPLGRARRAEALALLGSCEVERAAQALTGSIATLEAEMEEDAEAVVPLRDTVARLAAARTDLEAERQRLAEEHRARKAERIELEEAPAGTGAASTRPVRPDRSFRATLTAAGERVTDVMDALTDAVGRRLPFSRR